MFLREKSQTSESARCALPARLERRPLDLCPADRGRLGEECGSGAERDFVIARSPRMEAQGPTATKCPGFRKSANVLARGIEEYLATVRPWVTHPTSSTRNSVRVGDGPKKTCLSRSPYGLRAPAATSTGKRYTSNCRLRRWPRRLVNCSLQVRTNPPWPRE
jgi:hypothetical protein